MSTERNGIKTGGIRPGGGGGSGDGGSTIIDTERGLIDPYDGDITREGWGDLTYIPIR